MSEGAMKESLRDRKGREMMKIGRFARLLNVTPRTIRYYETLGLVKPTGRTEGGFRLYSPREALFLAAVFAFKEIGLSLGQISRLSRQGGRSLPVRALFGEVLAELDRLEAELDRKMDSLSRFRGEIERAKRHLQDCDGCNGKIFDRECVDCWVEKGDVPLPLNVMAGAVERIGGGPGVERGSGPKSPRSGKGGAP